VIFGFVLLEELMILQLVILHAKDVTVFLIGEYWEILGSENFFLDEALIRRWILPTLIHTGISRGTSPPRITIPANPHYIVPYGNCAFEKVL
jgi:hypothetical protein